jgi:hypothetical protein
MRPGAKTSLIFWVPRPLTFQPASVSTRSCHLFPLWQPATAKPCLSLVTCIQGTSRVYTLTMRNQHESNNISPDQASPTCPLPIRCPDIPPPSPRLPKSATADKEIQAQSATRRTAMPWLFGTALWGSSEHERTGYKYAVPNRSENCCRCSCLDSHVDHSMFNPCNGPMIS